MKEINADRRPRLGESGAIFQFPQPDSCSDESFLDETRIAELNDRLVLLQSILSLHPEAELTWYVPDAGRTAGHTGLANWR